MKNESVQQLGEGVSRRGFLAGMGVACAAGLTLAVAPRMGMAAEAKAASSSKDGEAKGAASSKKDKASSASDKVKAADAKPAKATAASPTADNPLVVDEAAKAILVYAEVNGTYFTEPTRHAVTYEGGRNGDKTILRSKAQMPDAYDALVKLGAEPGNNVTADDMDKGVSNTGTPMRATVKWEGQDEVPLQDCIRAETDKDYHMSLVFAGNRDANVKSNAGCLVCLDSCASGMITDASWPTGSTQEGPLKSVTFYANENVLPPDGSPVVVTLYVEG